MNKIKENLFESIFLLFWIVMVIAFGLYENYKLSQKIGKNFTPELNFPKPQKSMKIIEIDLSELK